MCIRVRLGTISTRKLYNLGYHVERLAGRRQIIEVSQGELSGKWLELIGTWKNGPILGFATAFARARVSAEDEAAPTCAAYGCGQFVAWQLMAIGNRYLNYLKTSKAP